MVEFVDPFASDGDFIFVDVYVVVVVFDVGHSQVLEIFEADVAFLIVDLFDVMVVFVVVVSVGLPFVVEALEGMKFLDVLLGHAFVLVELVSVLPMDLTIGFLGIGMTFLLVCDFHPF